MEEVLNGYVTNPTPNLTPNLNPNSNPTRINKKSKKKRLYKIDWAVYWMEKSANRLSLSVLKFVCKFHILFTINNLYCMS
jgi:hypothetical protein